MTWQTAVTRWRSGQPETIRKSDEDIQEPDVMWLRYANIRAMDEDKTLSEIVNDIYKQNGNER